MIPISVELQSYFAEGARLVLERPLETWILGVAALCLIAPFLRGRFRGHVLATPLRAGALVLVLLAFAGLAIETDEKTGGACVVVVVDRSESVAKSAEPEAARWWGLLSRGLGERDRLGAVELARTAQVRVAPGVASRAPALDWPEISQVERSATRIDAGLELAVPLCPEELERRILLVSDGNETEGDARRAAELVRESGAKLFVAIPPEAGGTSVTIEKLVTPPLVRQGSVFPLRVVVRSRAPGPLAGTLVLEGDGASVLERTVRVEPGLNVFELPHRFSERGAHELVASLAAGPGEDRREAKLTAAGPVRALVVSEERSPAVAKALKAKAIEVTTTLPSAFPSLDDLLEMQVVVLDDVPKKLLPERALATLETYVRRFGGGLVATGGARSFGDKEYQGSVLERVLPISFVEQRPPPSKKVRLPLGVFIVVDRSNSMTYSGSTKDLRDGEKMRYAKQAASTLLEQLADEDHVGFIAFDSEPYVIGDLRPLVEQRDQLLDRVERLLPGGGTDFKEALEIAASQLAADALRVRHIILLTDGDSNRGVADHDAILKALVDLRISVTTLRIGLDDVNLEFLQKISSVTGGRYHQVKNLAELPELLVRDARKATEDKDKEEAAAKGEPTPAPAPVGGDRPAIAEGGPIVEGFTARDFPVVDRTVLSKTKPGAELVLTLEGVDQPLPFVSAWQIGLGRAAVLLLDPTAESTADWQSWPGFGKLWSQLVRWTVRDEGAWETRQSVRRDGGRPAIEIETPDGRLDGRMTASILREGKPPLDLELTPVSQRLWRAEIPDLPNGQYSVLLTRREGERVVRQKRDVLDVTAADAPLVAPVNEEGARRRPDLDLLRALAQETGGTIDPDPAELMRPATGTRPVHQPLDHLLVPAAILLFLGDAWLRLRRS